MYQLLIVLILSINLFAMDATSVVSEVQKNNLSLKQQKYITEETHILHKSQRRTMLPSISLAAGYTHLGAPLAIDMEQTRTSLVDGMTQQTINIYDDISAQLPLPLTPLDYDQVHSDINALYPDNWELEMSPQDLFLASVIIKQPLLLGGKLLGASRITANQYNIAQSLEQKQQDLITQDALALYVGVLFAKAQLELRHSSLEAFSAHNNNTQKFIEQGILPAYYSLGTTAAVKLATVEVQQAQSFGQVQATSLKNRLHYPQDTTISLKDTLHYLPMAFDITTLDKAVMAYSPALQINQDKQEIIHHEKRVAAGKFLPTIFAVGEVQMYQKNLPVMTPPWMVGVQAQWDIFNGTRNILATKAAKLAEERSEISYERIKLEISEKVHNLYQGVTIAQQLYLSIEETVTMFEASLNAVQKEYANGRAKSIEVLDAQKRLDDIRLQAITTLYSYTLQLTELYTISGTITQFAQEFDSYEN